MRVIVVALPLLLLSGGAAATMLSVCGEREEVVANLEQIYSEEPVAIGLGNNGSLVEVLVSPTGTFTIIATRPNGWTCVIAAGEHYENHRPLPGYIPLKGVPV